MKVYFYCEENGTKNSGVPVLLGEACEYLDLIKDGCTAVASCDTREYDFKNTAICLGEFDGVHLGHKALFDEAKSNGKWGVLLFDRNIKGNEELTTQEEKIKLIETYGADYIVITEFSEEFSKKTPEEFASFLENTLKVSHVICGYDYHFGFKASGDASALKKLCKKSTVKIIDSVNLNGKSIKSTFIRNYIKTGDVLGANSFLGYNYSISGIVEKGFGNGRKMGFPTANIAYHDNKLLPKDGVYFGKVKDMDTVINIGKNPTFDAEKRTVEVHIIDFSEDIYGQNIKAEFLGKIRDDIKFNSIEGLIMQINNDIEYVKGRK